MLNEYGQSVTKRFRSYSLFFSCPSIGRIFVLMARIAIIGCGLIGETHAECLAALGSQATTFADIDFERAKSLADKFGGEAADVQSAIRDPNIDAVYICTYHDSHASLAIEAARNGKHIFLEKPMALTEKECYAIV